MLRAARSLEGAGYKQGRTHPAGVPAEVSRPGLRDPVPRDTGSVALSTELYSNGLQPRSLLVRLDRAKTIQNPAGLVEPSPTWSWRSAGKSVAGGWLLYSGPAMRTKQRPYPWATTRPMELAHTTLCCLLPGF